jgi:hypothetical protein
MIDLFKSEHLQRQFDSDGYATIPVLDADQIAALTRHYTDTVGERLGSASYPGLYITLTDETDPARRATVVRELNALVGAALASPKKLCRAACFFGEWEPRSLCLSWMRWCPR